MRVPGMANDRSKITHQHRLAVVLWDGSIGGAEVFGGMLVDRMNRLGATAEVVFIGRPEPLAARLLDLGVPYRSLDFERGRDILRRPRRYAAEVAQAGADGAILSECGIMAAALRAGGYKAPAIAIEHGTLHLLDGYSRSRRFLYRLARIGGARAVNCEVAVSDFMLEQMRRYSHALRICRIHNGIDPELYARPARSSEDPSVDLIVGVAGRLVDGKGVDHLLKAIALVNEHAAVKLLVAGDGPMRAELESLATALGVEPMVQFRGLTQDMPEFWQMCDVVAVPSVSTEAFPMTTLEAMASGKPVIATRIGGIPELVIDGETGALIPPGDAEACAKALRNYLRNPALCDCHGTRGRQYVAKHFHIDNCAQAYLDLFH